MARSVEDDFARGTALASADVEIAVKPSTKRSQHVAMDAATLQVSRLAAPEQAHKPRKFALLGGAGLKNLDESPQGQGFTDAMLSAIATFGAGGYETTVLFGDAERETAVQAPETKKVATAYGRPPGSFTRANIVASLKAITAQVGRGDEVVLMVDTHGYMSKPADRPRPDSADDPDYAFLTRLPDREETQLGKQQDALYANWFPGGKDYAAIGKKLKGIEKKLDAKMDERLVHLSDLTVFRDEIERRGGTMVVLLFTCSSAGGMGFGTDHTTVISETGFDKGEGVFPLTFLKYLRSGMSPEEAFAAARAHAPREGQPGGVEDPHISTKPALGHVANRPSGFRF